ncbi:MAG: hypothetical protein ACRDJU_02915 [Actinomycetota bacterium]
MYLLRVRSGLAGVDRLRHADHGTGHQRPGGGEANGQVANQVTYYGHLLYYFDQDTAPGQTSGDGVNNFDLLGPVGNVMLPAS